MFSISLRRHFHCHFRHYLRCKLPFPVNRGYRTKMGNSLTTEILTFNVSISRPWSTIKASNNKSAKEERIKMKKKLWHKKVSSKSILKHVLSTLNYVRPTVALQIRGLTEDQRTSYSSATFSSLWDFLWLVATFERSLGAPWCLKKEGTQWVLYAVWRNSFIYSFIYLKISPQGTTDTNSKQHIKTQKHRHKRNVNFVHYLPIYDSKTKNLLGPHILPNRTYSGLNTTLHMQHICKLYTKNMMY